MTDAISNDDVRVSNTTQFAHSMLPRATADEVARQQALPYKDDPMLIGYSMADAPLLTDASVRNRPEGSTTWPRVLRNLGAEAPGKQAYVEGVVKVETLSEKTARHYAKESGRENSGSADSIQGPQREIGFTASGVRLIAQ